MLSLIAIAVIAIALICAMAFAVTDSKDAVATNNQGQGHHGEEGKSMN